MTWWFENVARTIRRGYGVKPHGSEAKRREGYPIGQSVLHRGFVRLRPAQPMPATVATSRQWSLRAKDAAPRPEKTDVLTSKNAPFFTHFGKIFNSIKGLERYTSYEVQSQVKLQKNLSP